MRKYPVNTTLDPVGIKPGLENIVGGIIALLLMRWFGM